MHIHIHIDRQWKIMTTTAMPIMFIVYLFCLFLPFSVVSTFVFNLQRFVFHRMIWLFVVYSISRNHVLFFFLVLCCRLCMMTFAKITLFLYSLCFESSFTAYEKSIKIPIDWNQLCLILWNCFYIIWNKTQNSFLKFLMHVVFNYFY